MYERMELDACIFFLPVCCTYRRREPERKRLEFSVVASLMLTKLYRTFFFKLSEMLRTKWTKQELSCLSGLKFSLRFPDSSKIECSLPSTASSMVGPVGYNCVTLCMLCLIIT